MSRPMRKADEMSEEIRMSFIYAMQCATGDF